MRNLTASEPTQFILAWDPNAEADLDGYSIYYKDQAENAPYLFLGDVYVDELADRAAPMVTIINAYNDLEANPAVPSVEMAELVNDSTFFFALTAFDRQEQISDLSTELCVEVIGNTVLECGSAGNENNIDEADGPDKGSNIGDVKGSVDGSADSGDSSLNDESSADNADEGAGNVVDVGGDGADGDDPYVIGADSDATDDSTNDEAANGSVGGTDGSVPSGTDSADAGGQGDQNGSGGGGCFVGALF